MSFFKQFPKINYDLFEQGDLRVMTDIYRHVDVNNIAIDPFISYTYYEINEGDRPDNVSQKLYGSTDYYWTFFVINDTLKNGLSAWPKSTLGLERYITQEYDKNSVLTFSPVLETYNDVDVWVNTLNGLDMSHPFLRFRRAHNNKHTYARVSHYDSAMYQLYVYSVNDPDKFFTDDGVFYIETFNPYQNGSSDHINTEELNNEWREKQFAHIEKEHPYAHSVALSYLSEELSINLSNTSRIDYFKQYEIRIQSFGIRLQPSRVNRLGRNAPKEYLSVDGSEIITGYDALVTASALDPYPYLNTYVEYEREKNLEKRKIRVVKKSIINEFVDAYKDLIQS